MPASALAPLQPTACSGTPPANGLPSVQAVVTTEGGTQARRYRDRQKNFSILVPWNWTVWEKVGNVDLVAYPSSTPDGQTAQASLSVISQELPMRASLPLFAQYTKEILAIKLPHAKIQDEGDADICGVSAHWVLFLYYLTPKQPYLLLQYYFLSPNGMQAYSVSATAKQVDFGKFRPLFDSIINSFQEVYPKA